MGKFCSLLLLCLAVFSFSTTNTTAQVIFGPEDFQGTMGINGLPTGWTESGLSTDNIYDVGDEVMANTGGYWPVPAHTLFAQSNDDVCNCDKSEDRLILPSQDFTLVLGGIILYADVYHDGAYGGAANVEVSTNGGTTWDSVYAIPANNGAWQDGMAIGLSAYAGMNNVLIAFRYQDNGNWGSGLGVDNVRLESVPATDVDLAVVSSVDQYTQIPLDQATAVPSGATIMNNGPATSGIVELVTYLYKQGNPSPLSISISPGAPILAGNSSTLSNLASDFTTIPGAGAGVYTFVYIASDTSTNDPSAANDTLSFTFEVTDGPQTYARDNGIQTLALGIGAGSTAKVGYIFDISAATQMDSVIFLTNAVIGDTVQVEIYDVVAGMPNAMIGMSAEYIYTAVDTGVGVASMLPVTDLAMGALALAPGQYVVVVEEYFNVANMGIACTDDVFTPNTVFVNINGGAFQTIESVGFPNTPIIRPTFAAAQGCTPPTVQAAVTNIMCNGGSDGAVDLTVTGGTAPYTFAWDNTETTEDLSGLMAGTYTVTVTDALSCTVTTSATVTEPTALALSGTGTDESAPLANDGTVDLTVAGGTAPYTFMWDNAATTEDLSGLAGGTYAVTVTDNNGCVDSFSITISTIVGINDIQLLGDAVSLYPNPTSGLSTLDINLQTVSDLDIRITNVTGQVIREINDSGVAHKQYSIDLGNYASGLYMIRINANNQTVVRKLIVK